MSKQISYRLTVNDNKKKNWSLNMQMNWLKFKPYVKSLKYRIVGFNSLMEMFTNENYV